MLLVSNYFFISIFFFFFSQKHFSKKKKLILTGFYKINKFLKKKYNVVKFFFDAPQHSVSNKINQSKNINKKKKKKKKINDNNNKVVYIFFLIYKVILPHVLTAKKK